VHRVFRITLTVMETRGEGSHLRPVKPRTRVLGKRWSISIICPSPGMGGEQLLFHFSSGRGTACPRVRTAQFRGSRTHLPNDRQLRRSHDVSYGGAPATFELRVFTHTLRPFRGGRGRACQVDAPVVRGETRPAGDVIKRDDEWRGPDKVVHDTIERCSGISL